MINLVGAFLGIAVYRHERRGAVNRIFLLTIVLMLVWVNFAYAPRAIGQTNPDVALVLMRIAWTATPLFSASLYLLVVYLTHSQSRFRPLHYLVAGLAIAATFLAGYTDLVVASLRHVGNGTAINYGPGMWPFLGIISVIVLATALVFYGNYFKLPAENRLQLQYVGVGLTTFYVANIVFNIAFPVFFGIVRWYWIGDYSTLAVLALTAYAIVKKNLFGIRVVLTALLVAIIAIVLAADVVIFAQLNSVRVTKAFILLLFLYLGFMLVKSVHREIDQRMKLQEITAELRRSNEAKTEFISIVSHQLRTPLNAIEGYLSLLLDGTYGTLDRQKRIPLERVYR
ncbi:MAG TPA: histidine kinase dimerization/phospho-acceptor domain-containing protein, partial [Longimicrobiales bacterium]|nr:histidine kinase dimerization/phospho-acceptor domain-containing protein [Longimicrobiales bacterium]